MRRISILIIMLASRSILLAQTINKTDTAAQPQKAIQLTLTKTEGALMLATNNIVANIVRSPELANFSKYIENAGLTETFRSPGPITVFAPNNEAFNLLSKGKKDTLSRADHKYDLIALVTYHAIPGIVTAKDISRAINAGNGTATFTTLTGNKLTAHLDTNRNIVLIDETGRQSIVTKFDLSQSNGMLHIVNAVLIPQFKNI